MSSQPQPEIDLCNDELDMEKMDQMSGGLAVGLASGFSAFDDTGNLTRSTDAKGSQSKDAEATSDEWSASAFRKRQRCRWRDLNYRLGA